MTPIRVRSLAALAAACALVVSAGSAAYAADAPAMAKDGVLVDAKGMTLYTFAQDAAGKSACNGPCAANWPPLMAAASDQGAGDWSVITRDDGSKQWAYQGKPLYLWVKDEKPGDRTGDGVKGVWHVAKP